MRQVVLAEEELGRHSGRGRALLDDAPLPHARAVLAAPPRRPGRRGRAAQGRRRRLVMATSGGSDWVSPSTTADRGTGRLPARRAQGVLLAGPGRRGDLDVRDARRARPGRRRAARRRAAVVARRLDRRDLGHARACAAPPATTWCSTDVFVPAEKVVGTPALRRPRRSPARRGDPLRAAGRGRLPRRRRAARATRRVRLVAARASRRRRRCGRSGRCGRGCGSPSGRCSAPSTRSATTRALDEATLATVMTRQAARRRRGAGRRRHRAGGGRRGGVLPAFTAGAGLPRRARRPVPPAHPRGDARAPRAPGGGVGQYGRRGMITHSTM